MRYLLIIFIVFTVLNLLVPRAQKDLQTREPANVSNMVTQYIVH